MDNLNSVIKKRRKELGLSTRELASKSGISQGYISQLEKGIDIRTGKSIRPTVDIINKLAKGLNVPIDYLLGNDSEDPIQKVIDHADKMNLTPEQREAIEEYKKMPPNEQQKELLDAIETIKNLPEANREVLLKIIKVFSSSAE